MQTQQPAAAWAQEPVHMGQAAVLPHTHAVASATVQIDPPHPFCNLSRLHGPLVCASSTRPHAPHMLFDSAHTNHAPAPAVPLERPLSEEQAVADLAAIRSMWELAACWEFFAMFQHHLGLSQLYTIEELEVALVRSPGPGARWGGCWGQIALGCRWAWCWDGSRR